MIESFVREHGEFDSGSLEALPDFVLASEQRFVRILPGLLESEGGLDGFFIARLVRRG